MKIKILILAFLLAYANVLHAQKLKVVAPYQSLKVDENNEINLLGRKVSLDRNGFPKQLTSFLNDDLSAYDTVARRLLYENIHFHFVRKSDGKNLKFSDDGLTFTKKEAGMVKWLARSISDSIKVEVEGTLAYDGFLSYVVKVTALQNLSLKDITMHIPFQKTAANAIMTDGMERTPRPEKVEFKWDGSITNPDGIWIGNPNAGLQFSLSDEQYKPPYLSNFGLKRQQTLAKSWANEGRGGITVGIKGSSMLVNSYTGAIDMKKDQVVHYNFNLLLTPMHQ